MDAQMKKGVLDMCILYLISKEELYGYDIMQRMNCYFPEVNESTFYAILRRLNKEGAAETYLGEESLGPKRKYYRITEEGKERLSKERADFIRLVELVGRIGVIQESFS